MKQKKIIPYPLFDPDSPLLSSQANELDVFLNKPFWNWDKQKHDLDFLVDKNCCFNHIIGLPVKNDKQYPLFDYEQLLFNTIEQNQNTWILKSRGIGVTTFMIRYFAWKILSSHELDHKSIFIVSGTREEHANYIKEKLQALFENFPIRLESKYTELWLKKTWIKVFPTKNIKDIRGYFETSYIFVDESDYLEESIQDELIHAISPYEEKSNCKIILYSTPNRPDGLMQRIENDPNSKYYKLKLDYTYGLDKIYDRAFIEKKKLEPEFEREYNLKYLGKIGNVFNPLQIDQSIKLGNELNNIPISNYNLHSVGVDFGFSSSKTAIVMTEHLKTDEGEDKIIVRFAEEYDKANPQSIVDICHKLYRDYWNTLFYVDGANRGAVNLMKVAFDESLNWDTKDVNPEIMKIIPVNFTTEHKAMLSHLHIMINKNYLAIPKKYDKLITSLRTAYAREYSLDKEETSYSDSLDALRLSLKGYQIK
ncbi:MAG TPA: hypothetical protein VF220_01795 [Nitrososphaeraceae archaeon]